MRQLILDAGHTDVTLVYDLSRGFDLTGKLPPSHYFDDKFRPAALPCESLRSVADKAHLLLPWLCVSSSVGFWRASPEPFP